MPDPCGKSGPTEETPETAAPAKKKGVTFSDIVLNYGDGPCTSRMPGPSGESGSPSEVTSTSRLPGSCSSIAAAGESGPTTRKRSSPKKSR